jgi:hypothetical protein
MRVCQFRHFGTEFARLPGTGARYYLACMTILQYEQLMSNNEEARLPGPDSTLPLRQFRRSYSFGLEEITHSGGCGGHPWCACATQSPHDCL